MGEINLAMAGFYRFLLYDRSSFPQIHLHFKGKKQKRMRHSQYSRGFSKKKKVFIDEISDERNYFFHVVQEQVY